MKKLLIVVAACLLCEAGNAQQPAVVDPATMDIIAPEYVYCEIIADDLPSYTGEGVLFDFGQRTKPWVYNWLQNAEGENQIFNSSIEALNYMIRRGWEFVQAYTSGEKNQNTHMLLRIGTSKLTEDQLQQAFAEPRVKPAKPAKKK